MSPELVSQLQSSRELWHAISGGDLELAKRQILKFWNVDGPVPDITTPLRYYIGTLRNVSSSQLKQKMPFIFWLVDHGATVGNAEISSAIYHLARRKERHVVSITEDSKLAAAMLTALLLKLSGPLQTHSPGPYDRELAELNSHWDLYHWRSDEGNSPLHEAATVGASVAAEILLDADADIESRNSYGLTPAMKAAFSGQAGLLALLVKRGATTGASTVMGDSLQQIRPKLSEQVRDVLGLVAKYAVGPISSLEPGAAEYRLADKIHRTANGELVRSKSEVIIANALHYTGCRYHYEPSASTAFPPGVIPDFSIETKRGLVVWEHFGMLDDEKYFVRYKKKLAAYTEHGFVRDINLFVTVESSTSGLDSYEVQKIAANLSEL